MASPDAPRAPLRVRRIEIKKLFGLYDHDIHLNAEDGVTILHGPNGVGKTATLHLLMVLAGHYETLWKYPLERLKFTLNSGEYILFEVESKNNFDGTWFFKMTLTWGRLDQPQGIHVFSKSTFNIKDSYIKINHENSVLDSNIFSTWMNGYQIDNNNWLLLREYTRTELVNDLRNENCWWLDDEFVDLCFVNTSRLMYLNHEDKKEGYLRVNRYSAEMVVMIQSKLDKYDEMTRQGDQTFIKRLIDFKVSEGLNLNQLRTELVEIENGIIELQKIGVLNGLIKSDFESLSKSIQLEQLSVVSLYVIDMQEKLNIFTDIIQKINLFCHQLNLKLTHKSISVHAADGLVIRDRAGERLPLEALSSGEQHQIVLLYDLLFRTKPGTLVLIDEPELSLHLSWQERFLEDLLEVVKVTGIDVLLATHSPFIVGDRDDLMVALLAEPAP
jgi:predicted ATP-binding protein involved in virulence